MPPERQRTQPFYTTCREAAPLLFLFAPLGATFPFEPYEPFEPFEPSEPGPLRGPLVP